MKYLLFTAVLLLMVACDFGGNTGTPTTSTTDSTLIKLHPNYRNFNEYTMITIDGCEYIAYKSDPGNIYIEHKGNCKNPIHYQVKHDTLYVLKESGLILQRKQKK